MKGGCILHTYQRLAESVKISLKKGKVSLLEYDESLQFIGEGRSAFVFRIKWTDKVIKVFFPNQTETAREEAEIYKVLKDISYYPALHDAGSNYLIIDYIKGLTLFECLSQGKRITSGTIKEIDTALQLAREKGLNPSDIHLRNIFITAEKTIKVIDVARFRQTKNCEQWSDLKTAFYRVYLKPLFPKKIPAFILNIIAALYKRNLIPM
jgi:predicted Ser/Thr protein kinase